MERDTLSWRHLLALLITAAGAYGAWRGVQVAPDIVPPPPKVMHVRIAAPPPSPPPPVPLPPQRPQAQPQPVPRIARAPVANEPDATIAAPRPSPVTTPSAPSPSQPTAPSALPAQDVSASLEALYAAHLRDAVETMKHYPTGKDAMLEQPRGTVAVWVMLNRQGAVVDAGIAESRGSILNQAALQSVHRAVYPPFPAELYRGQSEHRFVVSLNYTPQ
jgi:protein TonB